MIIQNLHKKETQKKNRKPYNKFGLLFFFLLAIIQLQAQHNTVPKDSISEKKLIEFEQLFFDAITSKAINNYQKAVQQLEECNAILPNKKAVLFELSKNYFSLNKIPEATEYGNLALTQDPENLWIQQHLVKIYKKSSRFDKAIEVQKNIATKFPKKKGDLVFLYLMNNDRSNAKKLLNELAEAKLLNRRLRSLKSSLEKRAIRKKTTLKVSRNDNLRTAFHNDKSFKNLSKLLQKLEKENSKDLLSYSEQGLALFPAQPIVYLMNGIALNKNKAYKKAIETLKNGIDFVIDDKKMEQRFYLQLLKAYKGTGDTKNINKYNKKLSN